MIKLTNINDENIWVRSSHISIVSYVNNGAESWTQLEFTNGEMWNVKENVKDVLDKIDKYENQPSR